MATGATPNWGSVHFLGTPRVTVIGAGIAGLAATLELTARGCAVTLLDRASQPGGKMREVAVGTARLDAGPTVLTLRGIFDEIFANAGSSLDAAVTLRPLAILARHAWDQGGRLDLFADRNRSAEAIAEFAGPAEGRRYLEFCRQAKRIFETLDQPFIRADRPSMFGLISAFGPRRMGQLVHTQPFESMWHALGRHFHDARLQQLFGRYATYVGSSPFLAPATLMLVAHVEQEGVWQVEGGMHRLAEAMAGLATRNGAEVRYEAEAAEVVLERGAVAAVRLASGERIAADAVVVNADAAAVAGGRFGPAIAARGAAAGPGSTLALGRDLAHAGPHRGFPAASSQRVLLQRLPQRVRRRAAPRPPAADPHRLCLRPGPRRTTTPRSRVASASSASSTPRRPATRGPCRTRRSSNARSGHSGSWSVAD